MLAKRGSKPATRPDPEYPGSTKQRHDTFAGEASDQTDRAGGGGALGNFAEELGTLLGNTERKAAEWLAQRKRVTERLTAIRDKASSLLEQMSSLVPAMPSLPAIRRRRKLGRRPKTEGSTAPPAAKRGPGRPKKAKRAPMSAEAKARISEAQRRRWAAFRKSRG